MRKNYVDYIKALGIILVILGHINFANSNFGIKDWIYSFHMPLFFFASGLVIKEANLDKTFLFKKFNSLIIPFILWGLIYTELSFKNIAFIGYGSYTTLMNAGTLTSLWFLPAMFFGVIYTQLVFRFFRKKNQQIIAMFLLAVVGIFIPIIGYGYPWCIDVAILSEVFILFGYFSEQILSGKSSKLVIILTMIGFAGTMLFRINHVPDNGYVLMARRLVGNPILFYIVAVSGCFMIYGMARVIDVNGKQRKALSFIGSNTLAIFAVHKPIIKLCESAFMRFPLPWFLELIGTLVVVLSISCILVIVINRFVPMLNGRK